MAIKICPECGGKVSTSRDECIHCGYAFPKAKQCPDCGESCPPETKECPGCGYFFEDTDKAVSEASAPRKGDGQSGFRVSGGVLLSYSGSEAEARVPDGVVSIGSAAFKGNLALTKVTFPDSVASIGDEAFYGCVNLKELDNYSSVASFGRSAFEGAGLAEVEIGPAVVSIGESCFSNMRSLERLAYKPNKVLKLKNAFSDCPKLSDIEMDQEYFFFSKWESGRAQRPKEDNRPTAGDAFRRTAFMDKFNSNVNDCVCPKCGGRLTPTPVGRKCGSCGIYFEKDHYWSHREDKKPDGEVAPSDSITPSGEIISNGDGSPSCPYCHSGDLMEIGKGYYLCLACKMRFLDAQGASMGVSSSPDYASQAEAKANGSKPSGGAGPSLVPEVGASLEGEQEGGEDEDSDRKDIGKWRRRGMIALAIFSFLVFAFLFIWLSLSWHFNYRNSPIRDVAIFGLIFDFLALVLCVADLCSAAKWRKCPPLFWIGIGVKIVAIAFFATRAAFWGGGFAWWLWPVFFVPFSIPVAIYWLLYLLPEKKK